MKASKVVRILEKKTIEECIRKYIIVSSTTAENSRFGTFTTKDSMYEDMRKDLVDFISVAKCLKFDVFGYRIRISDGTLNERADAYMVHIIDPGVYTTNSTINDDIINPAKIEGQESMTLMSITKDLDHDQCIKAVKMWNELQFERRLKSWFDADGKLIVDKKCVTVDEEYSIDDKVLMDEVNRQAKMVMFGKEKIFEWSAELIEGSLVHYEIPMLYAAKAPGCDITSANIKDAKVYDLTENLKEYAMPDYSIYEEKEPVYKIDEAFKKHLIIAGILGFSQFVLFLCMFAHWLFIPVFFAAIGAAVYFLIKAISESPKGKKRAEAEKAAKERIKKAVDKCLDDMTEETVKKVRIEY
ncbi:MAG: hypothetical protein IJT49_03310 [Clostridia bacterium]|nr:hypothetical protein [Clostridia bacterium]